MPSSSRSSPSPCGCRASRGPLDLRYDAGVYYILGTSLAEGRGYRLLNEPGAIEAVQYPPVLPAIAALHQRVLGTTDPVVVGRGLRFTAAMLFIGYAIAVFALARRFLTSGFAFVTALLAILNAQALFLSDYFAADLPYTAVSMFFFLAPPGLGAGALAVGAFGLRTAGVALLGAWAAESLLHRQFRQALVRGGVGLAAVAGGRATSIGQARSPNSPIPRTPTSGPATSSTTSGTRRTWPTSIPSGPSSERRRGATWWPDWRPISGHPGDRASRDAATGLAGGRGGPPAGAFSRASALPDWTISAALVFLTALVIAGLVLLARAGHACWCSMSLDPSR